MNFSIIIPVYNRPEEMSEMLESLAKQSVKNFEVVVVEDGSSIPCKEVVDQYLDILKIQYITKPNSGRSLTRNVGMQKAKGDYFIFFDSDCILPNTYFEKLNTELANNYKDCFGGPDNALPTFSPLQKAINYAMTSFLTTGGIRGGGKKLRLEKFMPRSFNMGFSRQVYEKAGDFKDMFGEDIDLSIRIRKAGFSIALFQDVFVYHKRRVSLKKFYNQVNNFGKARIALYKTHPDSLKLVHCLPAVFVLGEVGLFLFAIIFSPWFLCLFILYFGAIFLDALLQSKLWEVAGLAVLTSFIQLNGYGIGFLQAFVEKVIFAKKLEEGADLHKTYNK